MTLEADRAWRDYLLKHPVARDLIMRDRGANMQATIGRQLLYAVDASLEAEGLPLRVRRRALETTVAAIFGQDPQRVIAAQRPEMTPAELRSVKRQVGEEIEANRRKQRAIAALQQRAIAAFAPQGDIPATPAESIFATLRLRQGHGRAVAVRASDPQERMPEDRARSSGVTAHLEELPICRHIERSTGSCPYAPSSSDRNHPRVWHFHPNLVQERVAADWLDHDAAAAHRLLRLLGATPEVAEVADWLAEATAALVGGEQTSFQERLMQSAPTAPLPLEDS